MDEEGKVEIFEPFSFFRHLFASLEKKRGATPDGHCCQNIIQFPFIKILYLCKEYFKQKCLESLGYLERKLNTENDTQTYSYIF